MSGYYIFTKNRIMKTSLLLNLFFAFNTLLIQTTFAENAPKVTTKSTASAVSLAHHLKSLNVKMYTTYWCPYCHKQKQLFGKDAYKIIDIIECDPKGNNSQTELCIKKGIKNLPSWEINGELVPGLHTLQELSRMSNYVK